MKTPTLGNPQNTIEILQKYNFNFQKKFGQNFLIDEHVLDKIIRAAEITKDDYVLEIGPGIGTMTQYLACAAREVTAVEIDRALIPILEDTLKEYDNVSIINEDILKVDIAALAKEKNGGRPIKVVANLPYYITTPIIMGLFESHVPLESITVMVQKEVADRMQVGPGTKDYGALSLAVQYYAEPYIVANVPPNCFMPRPAVGSAVIRLTRHQKPPVEADLVVGVPDSGLVAAKGYSEYSGIPYGMAFHKNSYVGRTFIKPKQSQRESSVKIKLNVIEEVVRGKRIVMVDDSIVRGTTCANIIKMLKKAGAKEVHVRISSPPFLHPCYFGTDVPSNDQLIAHSHTTEQIREMIGADSLGYMEIDKLKDMVGDLGYCDACFTGNYPMRVPGKDISHAFESEE